jgi:hypothetical protein
MNIYKHLHDTPEHHLDSSYVHKHHRVDLNHCKHDGSQTLSQYRTLASYPASCVYANTSRTAPHMHGCRVSKVSRGFGVFMQGQFLLASISHLWLYFVYSLLFLLF